MMLEKEKASEENKVKKPFQKEIKASLLFHAIVLGAFSLKNIIFSSPSIDYKSAIRVDIVGLPDKITSPMPPQKSEEPAAKAEEKKPEPPKKEEAVKPEEKVVPKAETKKDVKDVQKNALEKLKALDKIKNTVNTEKAQTDAIERLKKQEFRGNNLAAGNSLTGTDKFQYDAYIGELDSHVKGFWDLPRWLSEDQLKTVVKVKIDARGFVIFKQIVSSSGNSAYDEVAIQTVTKASPFPVPPGKFRGTLEVHGFNVEFQKQE
jgi:colicin import membrane protein